MNSAISLGRFRAETESYDNFLITYEDPLTPMSFSIHFDHLFKEWEFDYRGKCGRSLEGGVTYE